MEKYLKSIKSAEEYIEYRENILKLRELERQAPLILSAVGEMWENMGTDKVTVPFIVERTLREELQEKGFVVKSSFHIGETYISLPPKGLV